LSVSQFGVLIDVADMEAGLLPRRSLIRADKVHNLSQSEIIKPFGVLKLVAFEKVLTELDIALGR
jgi:hypothetical protein